MKKFQKFALICGCALSIIPFSGCTETQSTLGGAGGGAIVGGLIGNAIGGNAGMALGAVGGGLLGAGAGNYIGKESEKKEAAAQAAVARRASAAPIQTSYASALQKDVEEEQLKLRKEQLELERARVRKEHNRLYDEQHTVRPPAQTSY